jgi:hypothetical protein
MVVVSETPLDDAVTTAVWALVTVPALAVKLTELEPEAIVTDAGTLSVLALLESATVTPAEPAGPDTVTVQAAVPPELRLAGVQVSEVSDITADRLMVTVCELPL